MPKTMERALKREAKELGLGRERTNAYVYGTMRKTGWTPSAQKKHIGSKVKHSGHRANRS